MENVSAILSNGLGVVLGDLASRCYDARWICVRASDVGANHGRDRWWLLARKELADSGGEGIYERRRLESIGEKMRLIQGNEKEKPNMGNPEHDGQSAAEITGSPAQGGDHSKAWAQSAEQSARSSEQSEDVAEARDREADRAINFCQTRQGGGEFESSLGLLADELSPDLVSGWWEQEPDVGRVTTVSKDRENQLKALGNAQVPLQAAVAFSILMELFA